MIRSYVNRLPNFLEIANLVLLQQVLTSKLIELTYPFNPVTNLYENLFLDGYVLCCTRMSHVRFFRTYDVLL